MKKIISILILLAYFNITYAQVIICRPKEEQYWTGRVDSYQKIDEGIIVGRALLNVHRGWMKFDLSGIPDGATIDQVDLRFYVDVPSENPETFALTFSLLSVDPVDASYSSLRSGIVSNPQLTCLSCGETLEYRDLNLNHLIEEVKSSLEKDWIALGLYEQNEDSDNCHIHGYSGYEPQLTIYYSIPDQHDIAITNGQVVQPDPLYPGGQINVYCTQTYSGNSTSTIYSKVGYFLSSNSSCSTSDIFLGDDQSSLSVYDTQEDESETLTIPSYITPGVYYVCMIANYDNQIEEENQDNNAISYPIYISKPDCSIRATLRNWNNELATPSLTRFIRWPDGQEEIVGSNPGTFTELAADDYWVEGYQLGPLGEYEFWGSGYADLTQEDFRDITITRYTPYVEDFWFELNGTRLSPDDYVSPNLTLTPKAIIRNRDTESWSGTVEIGYRLDEGATIDIRSSSFSVTPESAYTLDFQPITFSSSSMGELYVYSKTTSSNQDNNPKTTDSWDWMKICEVIASTGVTYTYTPEYTGAVQNHRSYEGSKIFGRIVGSVPSEHPSESGVIHHRSFAGANIAGGTNWYVSDAIEFPISVPKSGFYKITFKGKINGGILAGRFAEIGHCAHYLSVNAGIYNVGIVQQELRNSLDEEWPSGLEYMAEETAKLILETIAASLTGGVSAVIHIVLDVYKTIQLINDLYEQLQQLRMYNNESLGNDGLTLYGYLEHGNHNVSFWVYSHNVVAVSGGVVTSIFDITAHLDEIILEELGGQNLSKPNAPSLILPLNGETNITLNPILSWSTSLDATSYRLQVATDANFSSIIIDEGNIKDNYHQISGLNNNTNYFWRVSASNTIGTSSYSEASSFTTIMPVPSAPIKISPSNGLTDVSTSPILNWNPAEGATIYRVEISTTEDFSSLVYEEDDIIGTSTQVTGLANNTFHFWRVNATNVSGTSSWSDVWYFQTKSSLEQNIELKSGWNILSYCLEKEDMSLLNYISPLISEGALIKMQDESGNAIEELPQPIGWIDNIGQMSITEGYKIKTTWDVIHNCTGSQVTLPVDIPLRSGWNIMGYPVMETRPALDVFSQMINSNYLLKVQDEQGNAIEELPEPIGWIDNISTLSAGEGYKVKVSNNCTITLEDNSGSKSLITNKEKVLPIYYTTAFKGYGLDHMNIYLYKPTKAGKALDPGDEVGIFDGEVCVGAEVISGSEHDLIAVKASLDDPTTPEQDGFIEGHPIEIRLWDNRSGQEKRTQKLEIFEGFNSIYEKYGTSVISVDFEESLLCFLGNAYPNPTKDKTVFTFGLAKPSKVRLEIFNITGELITILVDQYYPEGVHAVEWNNRTKKGKLQNPGLYYYRLTCNDLTQTKMLVIQ